MKKNSCLVLMICLILFQFGISQDKVDFEKDQLYEEINQIGMKELLKSIPDKDQLINDVFSVHNRDIIRTGNSWILKYAYTFKDIPIDGANVVMILNEDRSVRLFNHSIKECATPKEDDVILNEASIKTKIRSYFGVEKINFLNIQKIYIRNGIKLTLVYQVDFHVENDRYDRRLKIDATTGVLEIIKGAKDKDRVVKSLSQNRDGDNGSGGPSGPNGPTFTCDCSGTANTYLANPDPDESASCLPVPFTQRTNWYHLVEMDVANNPEDKAYYYDLNSNGKVIVASTLSNNGSNHFCYDVDTKEYMQAYTYLHVNNFLNQAAIPSTYTATIFVKVVVDDPNNNAGVNFFNNELSYTVTPGAQGSNEYLPLASDLFFSGYGGALTVLANESAMVGIDEDMKYGATDYLAQSYRWTVLGYGSSGSSTQHQCFDYGGTPALDIRTTRWTGGCYDVSGQDESKNQQIFASVWMAMEYIIDRNRSHDLFFEVMSSLNVAVADPNYSDIYTDQVIMARYINHLADISTAITTEEKCQIREMLLDRYTCAGLILPGSGSADYMMRYDVNDIGNEPYYPSNSHSWESPDLWNTTTTDGLINMPVNINAEAKNYLRARIKNIGDGAEPCEPQYLKLYWAMASTGLKWDEHWIDHREDIGIYTNVLVGDEVTTGLGIPIADMNIAPGETKITDAIEWSGFPDPTILLEAGLEDGKHICLYARIVNEYNEVYNAKGFREVSGSYATGINTHRFHRIVWKNTTIVDICEGGITPEIGVEKSVSIILRNPETEENVGIVTEPTGAVTEVNGVLDYGCEKDIYNVEFGVNAVPLPDGNIDPIGGPRMVVRDELFFDKINLYIEVPQDLKLAYQAITTGMSDEFQSYDMDQDGRVQIMSFDFRIPRLRLERNKIYPLRFIWEPKKDFDPCSFFVVQKDICGNVVGGETYVIMDDDCIGAYGKIIDKKGVTIKQDTNPRLYPNPSNDIINLENIDISNIKLLEIFTIGGKKVKSIDDIEERIFIGDIESGVYFMELQLNDGNKEVLKFIKN